MASLHEALQCLSPTPYSAVPTATESLTEFLRAEFSQARLIIESVPSSSSAASKQSSNDDELEKLQGVWGSRIKLSAKENPHNISVYKLSGADGRGAWFARRSVHEGLSFETWKEALSKELPQSLEAQAGTAGSSGAGRVKGLGSDKRIESKEVAGEGNMDVYNVSAQFPGPSAPRDFVQLVLSSDKVEGMQGGKYFMSISRPCEHDDCPPRSGTVRGKYESVEFIREVSENDVEASSQTSAKSTASGDQITATQNATKETNGKADNHEEKHDSQALPTEPRHFVEWIMVTRGDPGGNIPRFMVEKGTPAGIVGDADKFLKWATKFEFSPQSLVEDGKPPDGTPEDVETIEKSNTAEKTTGDTPEEPAHPKDFISSITDAAYAGIGRYTRRIFPENSNVSAEHSSVSSETHSITSSSADSFASAEDAMPGITTTESSHSAPLAKKISPEDKALAKLTRRRAVSEARLQKAKHKEVRNSQEITEKETARLKTAEERHAKDLEKAQEAYEKELKQAREKKEKEEKRALRKQEEERKKRERKQEEEVRKEEAKREKSEREDARKALATVKEERDNLRERVERLQGEKEKLISALEGFDEGSDILKGLGILKGNEVK